MEKNEANNICFEHIMIVLHYKNFGDNRIKLKLRTVVGKVNVLMRSRWVHQDIVSKIKRTWKQKIFVILKQIQTNCDCTVSLKNFIVVTIQSKT